MTNVKLCGLLFCCLLVGCAESTQQAAAPQPEQSVLPASTTSASPAAPSVDLQKAQSQVASSTNSSTDPCALITNPEVQAVQGEEVQETKRSNRTAGALLMSHCFYQLGTVDNSVSFEVTRGDPAKPDKAAVKDHWKEVFHKESTKPVSKKKDPGKPVKVSGIGDEAYWVGDRMVGALYVLQKDVYFRISVGGQHEQPVKLRKSKTLAQHALSRL